MKQIDWDHMAGKTVRECTHLDNKLAIIFQDETFIMIKAVSDYDGGLDIFGYEMDDILEFSMRDLTRAGICTEEEYWDCKRKKEEAYRDRTKEQELRKLAELKAKYEK